MSGSTSPVLVDQRVLVFTKYPRPGFAKTRLIPLLGSEKAAAVSRTLSERTIATVRGACASRNATPVVYYAKTDDDDEKLVRDWLTGLGSDLILRPQCDGGLGDRLRESFSESLETPDVDAKVLVVGVDIPELSIDIIDMAFRELDHADVVIGPAVDGGYYLLGMKKPHLALFDDVHWSTETVFQETVRNAERLDLRVKALQPLRDVDLPEDFEYFESICVAKT